jgi:hypothetical protein
VQGEKPDLLIYLWKKEDEDTIGFPYDIEIAPLRRIR